MHQVRTARAPSSQGPGASTWRMSWHSMLWFGRARSCFPSRPAWPTSFGGFQGAPTTTGQGVYASSVNSDFSSASGQLAPCCTCLSCVHISLHCFIAGFLDAWHSSEPNYITGAWNFCTGRNGLAIGIRGDTVTNVQCFFLFATVYWFCFVML